MQACALKATLATRMHIDPALAFHSKEASQLGHVPTFTRGIEFGLVARECWCCSESQGRIQMGGLLERRTKITWGVYFIYSGYQPKSTYGHIPMHVQAVSLCKAI